MITEVHHEVRYFSGSALAELQPVRTLNHKTHPQKTGVKPEDMEKGDYLMIDPANMKFDDEQQQLYEQELTKVRVLECLNGMMSDPRKIVSRFRT